MDGRWTVEDGYPGWLTADGTFIPLHQVGIQRREIYDPASDALVRLLDGHVVVTDLTEEAKT